jgi:hypothetical protein
MIFPEVNMPDEVIDLRKYASTTQRWILFGGLAVIVLVGLGLIAWIYGPASASLAMLCFVGMLAPVLLIVGFLALLQWIVRRSGRGDDSD